MVHIRNPLGALGCAALLCVGAAAHATTFDLSYTFASGDTIVGTVQGTLDGSFIDDVSNIHLAYDGDVFAGTLSAATWDPVNSQVDASTPARIATDASLNEFVITGSTGDYEFLFENNDAMVGSAVFAADDLLAVNNAAYEAPVQGSWIVAAVVPEPAPAALLLAGLGLVGTVARRRRV